MSMVSSCEWASLLGSCNRPALRDAPRQPASLRLVATPAWATGRHLTWGTSVMIYRHPDPGIRDVKVPVGSFGREIGVADSNARLAPPDPETYLIEVDRGSLASCYRAWRLGGIEPHLLADTDWLDAALNAVRVDIAGAPSITGEGLP